MLKISEVNEFEFLYSWHLVITLFQIPSETAGTLCRNMLNIISLLLADQEPLKGSVCSTIRTVLRSFTDVCDAVYALEIGLRFLGKSGGCPKSSLLTYLHDSLKMAQHISSSVAKVRITPVIIYYATNNALTPES